MDIRVCTKCNKTQPADFYYPKRRICKSCCREQMRQNYQERVSRPGFREAERERSRRDYAKNPERYKRAHRKYERKMRQEILDAYGGKCVCCGETRYEFLAFDHINGGGNKHIKEIGRLVRWLRKNNYPLGFRVLCHNCNMAMHHFKVCPHQHDQTIDYKRAVNLRL